LDGETAQKASEEYEELKPKDDDQSSQSTFDPTPDATLREKIFTLFSECVGITLSILAFLRLNKTGIIGFLCGVTVVAIISFLIDSNQLTLSKSHIYDYTFVPCKIDDEDTMCPTYTLNHTMYFRFKGVDIAPYAHRGEQRDSVFFAYDFCEETAIPKYPSNYRRHCNLMSAGIGAEVMSMGAFTMSLMSFAHSVVILIGFDPWNLWHKFVWVFALIAACGYIAACIIWQFMGHIDILANHELFSEAHAGMKVETQYGIAFLLMLLVAALSIVSAFSLRAYIWMMQIRAFRFMYADSESSSGVPCSAELEYMRELELSPTNNQLLR